LLTTSLFITSAVCRLLSFPEEDRIAAVFCGSKKTLASGVPMAAQNISGHDVPDT
jgi:sodium/bile acid cotransporter 7